MSRPRKTFLFSLVAYAVLAKVLPYLLMQFGLDIRSDAVYPWSFTPVFAIGLFGVAMFRRLNLGFGLPLLAWLAADLLIGLLAARQFGWQEGWRFGIYPGQLWNFAALILACGCGLLVRGRRSWGTILTASVVGPLIFFLVSNFCVWSFDVYQMYPRSLSGLEACYIAGLPFLRNSVLGTLVFSGVLFSPVGLRQLDASSESAPSAVPTLLD